MRSIPVSCAAIALALSSACVAQEGGWEVGGAVGFGVMRYATIDNAGGSASAGLDNRFVAGAVLGQNLYQHFSGELRYVYREDDLVLKSGGEKVATNGDSHLVHYDILFHPTSKESRVRPFLAAGAGIRFFRGTGEGDVNQPLSDFAFLTKTNEVKPLISVGGGVKARLTEHTSLRFDFREYISPFPENLFATAPGSKIQGWLFDSVPMAGLSFVF
jgi:hypothetical protein